MKVIFNKGIPGFEDIKEYRLERLESNPLFWELTAKEDNQIGFITIPPFEVDNKYEINLPDNVINELKIIKAESVMILNILTFGVDIKNTTVNLKAPVIINIDNGLGRQIILEGETYKIKTPLLRNEE